MRSTSLEKKQRHPLWSIALTVIALLAVANLTYWFVNRQGHVSRMPVVSISLESQSKLLKTLEKNASSIHPTSIEMKLISQLEEIHWLESDTSVAAPQLPVLIESYKSSLAEFARKDLSRFLAIGDLLAWQFQQALLKKLRTPPSKADTGVNMALMRHGGSFYTYAVKQGLISESNQISVSAALFGVIFRYRWRLMAGLDGTQGFNRHEQLLLYDFLVRFTDKGRPKRRLDAARKAADLVPSYNLLLAEGLIFMESGDTSEAVGRLRAGLEKENNPKAEALLKAILLR